MTPGRSLTDPRLRAFLPAVYLAWSDGELSAHETRSLCQLVATRALDASYRDVLGRWLDAEHPPSALELQDLLDTLATAARQLDRAQARTLTERPR